MAQPSACLARMKQGLILFKQGMTVHPFLPALEMEGKIRQTVSFGGCSLGWVKFLRHGLAIQSKLGQTIVEAPYLTHLAGIGVF